MKKILTSIIIICSTLNIIFAQSDNEPKPSPQWWLGSSLVDSVDQYLFHVEGAYSFTKMTGSIAGEMHSGSIKAVVRKNIFTNNAEYLIDKMDLNIKMLAMNYITESQVFSDYVDVDISKFLFCEGGFIWERDDALLIKNRYSLYVGLGFNGTIYEKHYLKILTAIGRIDQSYSIPVDGIDVVKGVHSVFYLRQTYKYVLDQRFSFMEQAYYLTNTNKYDRYRVGVNLSFYIAVVQPVSIMLGYNYKFDKESKLLGAIAENTTQTIGINISL